MSNYEDRFVKIRVVFLALYFENKSVRPQFFGISDISNSLSECSKSKKKICVVEDFAPTSLKWLVSVNSGICCHVVSLGGNHCSTFSRRVRLRTVPPNTKVKKNGLVSIQNAVDRVLYKTVVISSYNLHYQYHSKYNSCAQILKNPQSAGISGSENMLNYYFESEIRTKSFPKSADPNCFDFVLWPRAAWSSLYW